MKIRRIWTNAVPGEKCCGAVADKLNIVRAELAVKISATKLVRIVADMLMVL